MDSPASIFSIAILPRISVELNNSYDAIGSSPEPSAARTRGRVTGTRRPPNVTEPRSLPCRTAVRAPSCLPLGPASALTSASINDCITCKPAPTANASRPSCIFSAISAIATLTCSGNPAVVASTGRFWLLFFTAVPLL